MSLPRQFHVLVVQNPGEREDVELRFAVVPVRPGRRRSASSRCPSPSPGLLVFPEAGAEVDLGFIPRPPADTSTATSSRWWRSSWGFLRAVMAMIVAASLDCPRSSPGTGCGPSMPLRRSIEDIDRIMLFYTAAGHVRRARRRDSLWARIEGGELVGLGRDGAPVFHRRRAVRARPSCRALPAPGRPLGRRRGGSRRASSGGSTR